MIKNKRLGYFHRFSVKIANKVKDKIKLGFIFEVKHVKKLMGISSNDRSRTAFISRSLDTMASFNMIKYHGKTTTKKYKKFKEINQLEILEFISWMERKIPSNG